MKTTLFKNLCLVFILLISCKQKTLEDEYKSCLDHRLNESKGFYDYYYKSSEDIYATFSKIETFFTNKGYIQDIYNKDNYKVFITNVIQHRVNHRELYEALKKEIGDVRLDLLISNLSSGILVNCPDYVLVTEENEYLSTLNMQKGFRNGITQGYFRDVEMIKEGMEVTKDKDFEKLMYRIPFIYVILFNINPEN